MESLGSGVAQCETFVSSSLYRSTSIVFVLSQLLFSCFVCIGKVYFCFVDVIHKRCLALRWVVWDTCGEAITA